jgi:digeranylgeranylglycerophospholipid reductase
MKPITCHILVIGAGPAGSSAAIAAAKKGWMYWWWSSGPKSAYPFSAPNTFPALLVGQLNLGTGFVVQKVSQMRTILPDGSTTDMAAPVL